MSDTVQPAEGEYEDWAADIIIYYFDTHGINDARAGAFNIIDRLKEAGLAIVPARAQPSDGGVAGEPVACDGVAQRIEQSEPDEGRKDAGSTPVAVALPPIPGNEGRAIDEAKEADRYYDMASEFGHQLQKLSASVQEAIELLLERTRGNDARSPGHNARLLLQEALKRVTPSAFPRSEGGAL